MQNGLVKALLAIQHERKMTERQFADWLGISHTMMQYLRAGHRQPGRRVLKAIADKLPELNGHIMDFITK